MARRRTMQRPGMARPNMPINAVMARNAGRTGNAGMARNAGFGKKPAMPMPESFMPEKLGRQIGAMPAGIKPRNTFWTRVPVIGGLMNLITGILFPKSHLRVMQRKRIGTGLGARRERTLRSEEHTSELQSH